MLESVPDADSQEYLFAKLSSILFDASPRDQVRFGNIARLLAPNVSSAVGRTVTMRVGGAVKLGSTRIGGSGTPRDYAVKIVGVFDEQASQTSFRIPLDDALLAGAENRGLTPDAIRITTG